MEVLTWLLLGLNLVGVILSWWAATTAKSALREFRRSLASSSARSLTALDAEVSNLAVSLSSITTTVRRLSSRIGMQDSRARGGSTENLPENPQERKAAIRRGLAKGELVVIRDNPAASGR